MTYKLLLVFVALFIFISCGEEEGTIQVPDYSDTSFILDTSFPGCTDHEVTDLTDDGLSHIYGYEIWNGLYFINTFNNLIVRSGGFDGSTILQESISTRKLLPTNERMYISSFEGLFSVDENGVLTQHFSDSCGDIVLSPKGEVILSAVADFKAYQLLKLEDDFTLSAYTDNHEATTNCVPLEDIQFVGENDVFASTCEGFIVHFRDGKYVESLGPDQMNLTGTPSSDQFFIRAHEDDLIVVAKNGPYLYSILKYTAEGEWISLKHFGSATSLDSKDIYMRGPSITDALIFNDKLYLTTTIAGCRGIQEFDITRNEELSIDDYHVIQDPNFPSQCLEGIQLDQEGNFSFITSHGEIVRMTCN